MKSMSRKWISLCLIVLLVFGCCAVAFADPESAGSGSMRDNYETYFTQVHEIEKFPDADGKYTLRDGVIYLDGFYMGWSDDPAERTVLEDEVFYDASDVAVYRPTNAYIYFVEKDGCAIRRLSVSTMRIDTIYEGDAPIEQLDGDDTCLFFRAENRLYRMYVKTGEARVVFRIPDMEYYMTFVDWNDTDVEILYYTDENRTTAIPGILTENSAGYFTEDGGLAFMLNCTTGALRGESSEEYYERRSTLGEEITISPDEIQTDTGGVDFWYLDLPNRAIRNKLGSFFSSHLPGKEYKSSYGGATQCTAFAKNIYAILHGYPESNVFRGGMERKFFDGVAGTNYKDHGAVKLNEQIVKSIPDASHARVHFSNPKNPEGGHSIMVIGRTADSVIVYDANRKNDDIIRMTKFKFAEFKSAFENINYYDNPNVKSNHVHDRTRCLSVNQATHAYYCTCYTHRSTENHTFTQVQPTEGLWLYHCTKCGYEYPVD